MPVHMRRRSPVAFLIAALGSAAVVGPVAQGLPIEQVSVSAAGARGNADSGTQGISISADGRFVAFESAATNLVPGDTNGDSDVFVRDRQVGTLERISVTAEGLQADNHSSAPSISGDGRYVAFQSEAANLVPGDANGSTDVFVKDRQTGLVERVSAAADGSEGTGRSYGPAISADGRYVVFQSDSANLVPDDANSRADVFVKDRATGAIERVNLSQDGSEADGGSLSGADGPTISADGRYVAFASTADKLVPGDTNEFQDLFVKDRQTGSLERVSVTQDGQQANASGHEPRISADGRTVAFSSMADNLVPEDTNETIDIFVKDRQTGDLRRVSAAANGTEGNAASQQPSLSAHGRYVAFVSSADNLVSGDTNKVADVFVKDRQLGSIERVSLAADGTEQDNTGGFDAFNPVLTPDARDAVFTSTSDNLVSPDTNDAYDVFFTETGLDDSHAPCLPGDVTGDSQVNVADAVAALRASVNLLALTPEQKAAADVNGDGAVNVADAVKILKRAIHLPDDSWPTGC